ncbi:MAG: hypothetical protein KJ822_06210 [Proteobacteria bacterium]|nr:hypothetical protein [Pseudomonadota bacterium]
MVEVAQSLPDGRINKAELARIRREGLSHPPDRRPPGGGPAAGGHCPPSPPHHFCPRHGNPDLQGEPVRISACRLPRPGGSGIVGPQEVIGMNRPHLGVTGQRFWVVVFALVSLGVMAGGLAYYRYEYGRICRDKYQELAAIAELKVGQILEWRRERLSDAGRIVRSPFLAKAIANWLQDPGNPGLRAALPTSIWPNS